MRLYVSTSCFVRHHLSKPPGLIMLAMYISEGKSHSTFKPQHYRTIESGIMCIRTWALWRRNFRIGVGLIIMMTICLVAQCYVIAKFNPTLVSTFNFACIESKIGAKKGTVQPPPFRGFRGCFLTGAGSILGYTYVIWLIVDAGTCPIRFFRFCELIFSKLCSH
jgi:hypothetical protein